MPLSAYDYVLAGATGQIGQLLRMYLEQYGSVFLFERGMSQYEVPPCTHIINAAGYTQFNDRFERYWNDNVRLAVDLATAARRRGAWFHQLSSEAVAEFNVPELSEYAMPIPNSRMNHYALSKVLVEHAVAAVAPPERLAIYRCSDVVPGRDTFESYWRHNHWLSVLFSVGKEGFRQRDQYPIWLASVQDMAKALTLLINNEQSGFFHLLGNISTWEQFWEVAKPSGRINDHMWRMVDQVTEVVRIRPALATTIDQRDTLALLRRHGFKWTRLGMDYWKEFAQYAVE